MVAKLQATKLQSASSFTFLSATLCARGAEGRGADCNGVCWPAHALWLCLQTGHTCPKRKIEPRQIPHAAPSSNGDGGGGSLKNERAALRQVPLRDTSEQARRRCRQRQRRQRQLSEQSERDSTNMHEWARVCVSLCLCVEPPTAAGAYVTAETEACRESKRATTAWECVRVLLTLC